MKQLNAILKNSIIILWWTGAHREGILFNILLDTRKTVACQNSVQIDELSITGDAKYRTYEIWRDSLEIY